MGHTVSGLIAKRAPLLGAVAPPWVVAPLAQGFGIAVRDDVAAYPEEPLPDEITALAVTVTRMTPVAAIITAYFGGEGSQAAAAWRGSETLAYGEAGNAINKALEFIGVSAGDARDAFDAVGLGWFRSNENWIEFAKNGKLHYEREPQGPAYDAWIEHNKSN